MTHRIPIVPAIIPADETAVKDFAARLSFSPELHLDLVDGKFVRAVSWPYQPVGDPQAVAQALAAYTLEVDLMVADSLAAASAWEAAGADRLVFHVETLTQAAFAHYSEHSSVSVGVSAHGATPLETLLAYAKTADFVQLMGIYEIGAQGCPFDDVVLDKIPAVQAAFPDLSITIDGSVNADTITQLYEAGADRFIVGSAISLQSDPQAAHAQLAALINRA